MPSTLNEKKKLTPFLSSSEFCLPVEQILIKELQTIPTCNLLQNKENNYNQNIIFRHTNFFSSRVHKASIAVQLVLDGNVVSLQATKSSAVYICSDERYSSRCFFFFFFFFFQPRYMSNSYLKNRKLDMYITPSRSNIVHIVTMWTALE